MIFVMLAWISKINFDLRDYSMEFFDFHGFHNSRLEFYNLHYFRLSIFHSMLSCLKDQVYLLLNFLHDLQYVIHLWNEGRENEK